MRLDLCSLLVHGGRADMYCAVTHAAFLMRHKAICHAHLIARMNAQLLFEGGSYFFEFAKLVATIRGRLLFK